MPQSYLFFFHSLLTEGKLLLLFSFMPMSMLLIFIYELLDLDCETVFFLFDLISLSCLVDIDITECSFLSP